MQFSFIPTDGVCWYFLSHLRGGEMWKKKGEVVQLWCDLSTQENTVCVWHGKQTQWKESLLFTSGNSKHFIVSVQPHRKTFGYSRLTHQRIFRVNCNFQRQNSETKTLQNVTKELDASVRLWCLQTRQNFFINALFNDQE